MRLNRIAACVISAILIANSLGIAGDKYDPTTLVFPSFLHTMGIRKATKMHLLIYTRNKVKVKNPQGIAVVRLESWDDPSTREDDDEVTGYGVNSGENVIVFNKSMTSLGFYGKNATGIKRLNQPTAIAANETGDVYVADTGNHRIVRLFNPKQELKFVRAIGGKGALAGQFDSPSGVALDSNGMVYISDTNNHRIQVIRPDNQLHIWFGDQGADSGHLWHPAGITATNGSERWSHFKDAFIVVIDLDGQRLQKFTLAGQFLKAAKVTDLGFEESQLMYLAIDYYSNIWVTDMRNHCIHKFDRDLNYLTSFGRKGSGDKEFHEPRGIAIYKRFGQVFVAEKESAQYYWIGTDVLDFKARSAAENSHMMLTFLLTEPSYLTLTVTAGQDGEETTVFERAKYFMGEHTIALDANWHILRNGQIDEQTSNPANSNRFKAGTYTFKLKAEATYSSINYFAKKLEMQLTIP